LRHSDIVVAADTIGGLHVVTLFMLVALIRFRDQACL